jgi:hypothetical protein
MVNPTIDNEKISIVLNPNESFTVPDGQVIKATLTASRVSVFTINSVRFFTVNDGSLNSNTVFVGGDVIQPGDDSVNHIGGFVVS